MVTTHIVDNFETFGRCLCLKNAALEVLVTIDCGPRVISLRLTDGENILFTDPQGQAVCRVPELEAAFGPGAFYRFYGGHRLWVAPELYEMTYVPDDEPVTVDLLPDGAMFTPPKQKTGLQMSVKITLSEDDAPTLTVTHSVDNQSGKTLCLAPWALTQLAPGGVAVIPQPKADTGMLSDRLMGIWPYTDMGDPRVSWGDDAIVLRQDPSATRSFKIGLNNRAGWALYYLHNTVFVKKFGYDPALPYPDGGMNFETYTDARFIELESLDFLREMKPSQVAIHEETWSLASAPQGFDKNDPAAALAFAKKFL